MSKDSIHEKFATSLLTQSLVRNGYLVREPMLHNELHDLLAEGKSGERFTIDVKWVSQASSIHRLKIPRKTKNEGPSYVAVVVGNGNTVVASRELINRLKSRDPAVRIEPIDNYLTP